MLRSAGAIGHTEDETVMTLVNLETHSVEPYQNGRTWGEYGPYEVVRGTANFAVDPLAEANSTIVDLTHAERDRAGLVTFDADFRVVRPVEFIEYKTDESA